jgi:hypothetical protein
MHSHALVLPQVDGLAYEVDGMTGFADRGFADPAMEGTGFERSVPRKTPGVRVGVGDRSRHLFC